MIDIEISKKYNFMFPYMQHVKEICAPFLEQYNLNYFWYSRVYLDGSFIDITNYDDWFNYMLERDYYDFWNELRFHPKMWPLQEIKLISTPKSLSINLPPNELKVIIDKYKIYHIFNLLIRRNNYLENFAFSANIEHSEAPLMYSRYFGILKAFGVYFSQQYASLIKQVENQGKILLPSLKSCEPPQNLYCLRYRNTVKNEWTDKNLKHYFIHTPQGDLKISSRQKECLSVLSQGYTTKKAANILDISPRTLEVHLARLKEKTHLSRSELIQAILKSGL